MGSPILILVKDAPIRMENFLSTMVGMAEPTLEKVRKPPRGGRLHFGSWFQKIPFILST